MSLPQFVKSFKLRSILCIFILNFHKIETMITEVVPSEVFLFYQPTLLHQHFIKNLNNFWKFIFHFHEMIFMFVKVNNFGSLWSPLDEIHFGKHDFHFLKVEDHWLDFLLDWFLHMISMFPKWTHPSESLCKNKNHFAILKS